MREPTIAEVREKVKALEVDAKIAAGNWRNLHYGDDRQKNAHGWECRERALRDVLELLEPKPNPKCKNCGKFIRKSMYNTGWTHDDSRGTFACYPNVSAEPVE